MAKETNTAKQKTKSQKKKKPSLISRIRSYVVFDEKDTKILRFVTGVAFSILSLITLISIISYLFTWNEDQSLLHNPELMDSVVEASNSGGKAGFLLSDIMVGRLFGLGAFIIPFFFAGIAVVCFRIRKMNLIRLFFLSLMGCIVFSMTFSYVFSLFSAEAVFGNGAGGSYGYSINKWTVSMLGKIGTGAVLLFLILLWAILLNNKVVDWITGIFNRIFRKEEEADESLIVDEDEETSDEEEDEENEDGEEDEEEDSEAGDNDSEKESEDEDEDKQDDSEDASGNDAIELEILDTPSVQDEPAPESKPQDLPLTVDNDSENYSNVLNDDQWRTRYDPRLSLSSYKMPHLGLLKDYNDQVNVVSREELEKNKNKIVNSLRNYKIEITKISARIGPTVTLYEIVPAPGIRVSQIKRLEEDLALSLSAIGVRIVTLVGTNAVGIEVANEKPSTVSMKSVLEAPEFVNSKYDLPIALGKTISNEVMCLDLAKMPHLLVAGATGQGKSVGLNAIITSLLYKKHPAELKFVLVDPKKVELSLYSPIENHYLAQLPDADEAIITDNQKVVYTLRSLCKLMDRRYDLLKAASVRNIKEYNEKFLSRRLNPEKGHEFMPYIVVVIDEFADLLMTAGREVEEPIARLAQLARAIGIHLVIATQRPTTNIITGTIKANFPARIAFRVISSIDSKTILDQTGANQLIGRGDMLVSTGSAEPVRVQCAFIDTPEVNNLSEYIHRQQSFGGPYILPEFHPEELEGGSVFSSGGSSSSPERDSLFEEAARLIVREQSGSTSLIQRKMNLGYNRAGRIMDQLEEAGIVGPSEGSKVRQVRITSLESLDLILSRLRQE